MVLQNVESPGRTSFKGQGLADLRGEDPNGRRLQLEKQEQYAQALRQQIIENQQRKEAAAASKRDRGQSKPAQRCSSDSPARSRQLLEQGPSSEPRLRSTLLSRGVSAPAGSTCGSSSPITLLSRGVSAPAGSMCGLSSAELLSQAKALRLSSCGHAGTSEEPSSGSESKAPVLRVGSSTPAATVSADRDDAIALNANDPDSREQTAPGQQDLTERAAPGVMEEKTMDLSSLLQERLRAVEDAQKEQWIFIQNALQGQLTSACEAAEKAAEGAAKRQLEESLGTRLSELQRLCEDALDAASHGTEDVRAELRKAIAKQGGELHKLREELHEEMRDMAGAAAATCREAIESARIEEQNQSQATGDSTALDLLQAAQEEEQKAVGELLRRVEAAELALLGMRQALNERAAECVRHEERLAAHAAEIRKTRSTLSAGDPDSVYSVVQQLREEVTRQLGKLALRIEVVQRRVGASAGALLRPVPQEEAVEQPLSTIAPDEN